MMLGLMLTVLFREKCSFRDKSVASMLESQVRMDRDGGDQVSVEGIQLVFSDKVWIVIIITIVPITIVILTMIQVATNGVIHVVDGIIETQDSLSLTQVGCIAKHQTFETGSKSC